MEQEYIITVFSENKVGLLSQITTVFTCRNVNIESLTTSESALAGIHKFTIVVRTDPEKIEKLARQVEKRIDVLKVFVFTSDEVVQQEIANCSNCCNPTAYSSSCAAARWRSSNRGANCSTNISKNSHETTENFHKKQLRLWHRSISAV